MKKTKIEKGITLLALIITIVVLLILAVVSIGAIKNSGIIGHAQDASSEYTIEQEKEQIQLALNEWQIQKYIPDNTETFNDVIISALRSNKDVKSVEGNEDNGPLIITFKTGNQYKVNSDGEITKVTLSTQVSSLTLLEMYENGKDCTEENCTNQNHLHQGDYVKYSPNGKISYELKSSESGMTDSQTIERENLAWRVLGSDGTKILLISAEPTLDGPQLSGQTGYDNYETTLNTICSELYSNSSIGAEARSVNLNDLTTYLGALKNYENDSEEEEFYQNLKAIEKIKKELLSGKSFDYGVGIFTEEIDYDWETEDSEEFMRYLFSYLVAEKIDEGNRKNVVFYELFWYDTKNCFDGYGKCDFYNGNCRYFRPLVELDSETTTNDIKKLESSEIPELSWYDQYGYNLGS